MCRIDGGQLEFALRVLQKAAEYNGRLQQLQGTLPEESAASKALEAEYFILRTALVSLSAPETCPDSGLTV